MSMRLFSLLCILLSVNIAVSQEAPEIVPVSPEAAALAKMVNYPINHNTGIPNINIPFYEASVGDIKIPIVLNYHAGGFKINEQSTRVGLGWSLSCDLQITRTINGGDDFGGENSTGYIENKLITYLDPDNHTYSYPFTDLSLGGTGAHIAGNSQDLSDGTKDAMPDKFNYKLLNKSGSFYFKKNNTTSHYNEYSIVTIPYDNIKITYENSVFTIVDTDGTIYKFGTEGDIYLDQIQNIRKEFSGSFINPKVTSWKCHTIRSNTDLITFNYEMKSIKTVNSYSESIDFYSNPSGVHPMNATQIAYDNPLDYLDITSATFHNLPSPKYYTYQGDEKKLHFPYFNSQNNLTEKVFDVSNQTSNNSYFYSLSLKEIDLDRGGKIEFTGANELSTIKVSDFTGAETKSLKLHHDLVNQYIGNNTYSQGTLYLDSLEITQGSIVYDKYDFLYHSKFDFGDHLMGHDVWGYCNESTQVIPNIPPSSLLTIPKITRLEDIPYFTSNSVSGYDNVKDEISLGSTDYWVEYPHEPSMTEGVLKRIVYPTGGAVDFHFESNKYLKRYTSTSYPTLTDIPQISGGLRIKNINYFDEDNTIKTQKYYRYGDLEEGTGLLMREPKRTSDIDEFYYGVESYDQNVVYLEGTSPNPCQTHACLTISHSNIKTTYRPVSALDYTYANGAPIYYTKVTEYQQDLGTQTGKTVYSYYDPDTYRVYPTPSISQNLVEGTPIKYLKTDWYLGAQKSIETYKYDDDLGYKPINKKSFNYMALDKSDDLGRIAIAYVFQKNIKTLISGLYQGSIYHFLDKSVYSATGEEDYIAYNSGIPIGKLLLKEEKEEIFDDNNGVITNITTYDYDEDYPIQPITITNTNSKGDVIVTNRKYAYNSYSTSSIYQDMRAANLLTDLVEEETINLSDNNRSVFKKNITYEATGVGYNPILPKTIETTIKGETDTALTFDKYDQYGNILQYTNRVNGFPTSYLWGYVGMYPVAELKNVAHDDISTDYTNGTIINTSASESLLLSKLTDLRGDYNTANQMVSTYTYKRNIGVSTMTDSKDYSHTYEYDDIGRLVLQKDNDGNILQENAYNLRDSRNTQNFYYYNEPQMRTIDYDCTTGQVVNYIATGGSIDSTTSEFVDIETRGALNIAANNVSNPFSNCTSAVPIEFTYIYDDGASSPHASIMEVDFIQDGHVIATQIIHPTRLSNQNTSLQTSKLILNPGSYQVSFRMSSNVKYSNGVFPIFRLETNNSSNITSIDNGQTITLSSSNTYKILVTGGVI